MTVIRPFRGIRPAAGLTASIAALPYDVYTRAEAKEVIQKNPLSFLKIDRAETQFSEETDMYSEEVYACARDTFLKMQKDGSFIQDNSDCFYLYALTMDGRTQTGIVGCASIDDYLNGTIRKHENTRADKELDRIRHIDALNAQTGPIFLAYRQNQPLHDIKEEVKSGAPISDFVSEDGIRHRIWKISDPQTCQEITQLFAQIDHVYIADGHHRAASAVKVGLKRRKAHPGHNGSEEFNYFLSVLFPEEELKIYDYNRVVEDMNGHTVEELLEALKKDFDVSVIQPAGQTDADHTIQTDLDYTIHTDINLAVQTAAAASSADDMFYRYRPAAKGTFSMYCGKTWYKLTAKPHLYNEDPVDRLDVSILQNAVLCPLLGIKDVKTDSRIRFVGGIRGLEELMRLVDDKPGRIAFAMYPTSMNELLAVADAGRLMPPKSTWFEPKLRSGLFIHSY